MIEAGSSTRTGSPTNNTRTTTTITQPSGGNAIPKQSRRTPTAARIGRQPHTRKKETTQVAEERGQGTTSGVSPLQKTRKPTQGKDARNKRKCEIEDPNITLTWDDGDIIVDKLQDRSEEVVRVVEA